MNRKQLAFFLILSAVVVGFGCSDRGTNVSEPGYDYRDPFHATYYKADHMFPEELMLSMFASVRGRPLIVTRIYVPPGYEHQTSGQVYPVLYLLAPFQGNELYYFDRGLAAVADKMIAEGEIEPMMIVCLDGSHGYGATFYGDNWAGGRYTRIIGSIQTLYNAGSIIDYIDDIFASDTLPGGRAISGFGIGGYGAMRVAAEYSHNYGAVSAVSAPLDFDDAGGGFVALFEQIIDDLDTTGSGTLSLADYKALDSTAGDALTMIMGASCSFSPYPEYDSLIGYDLNQNNGIAGDTTYFSDTTTLISDGEIQFLLPFDSSGAVHDTVWSLWMNNNVDSMILNKYPTAFDSLAVGLFIAEDEGYGFSAQTRSFSNFLSSRYPSRDFTPMVFGGQGNTVVTIDKYVYDILPAVLKFHSDNFVSPPNPKDP
jgi:S-formylglutathione hydrolase FrmB